MTASRRLFELERQLQLPRPRTGDELRTLIRARDEAKKLVLMHDAAALGLHLEDMLRRQREGQG